MSAKLFIILNHKRQLISIARKILFPNILLPVTISALGVRIQVLGAVPMIQVDKTDGCQMFLSKDSINAEIVTAKSSEMNVLVPKDDDDFVEMPIPEQFKSVINGLAIITNPTESV